MPYQTTDGGRYHSCFKGTPFGFELWSISNTMDADWYCQVLAETLATHPAPEIFNTDQGSQFTSETFTALLLKAEVRVSMDGKGQALVL